jgi:tagatose 6-phosphate kinase
VVLDADGEGLRRALAARPDIVKINRAELGGLARSEGDVAGAQELRDAGARMVVITRGAEGLIAVAEGPALLAAPPVAVRGNPTGAGDAASAALAIALADGTPWPQALAEAAALSAAAAAAPVAGAFDAARYGELRARVRTRELREEFPPKLL